MYVEKSNDFTPCPAGVHKAVCVRFVDLGTQTDDGPYGHQVRRQVMISWEIAEERVEVDGNDLPMIFNQYYTWSMHEKANLRQALEAWRGKGFNDDDLCGPPKGFNTRNLIGVGCQIHIMHNEKGKAKLKSIIPLKKEDWPKLEGVPVYFQMQEQPLDMTAYDRLSDFHKGKIMASPQWGAMTGQSQSANENYGDSVADDDIPF